ncbi:MAG: 30S ribosome-binding factor RbfA [Halioglobus sp.]|jgi:ribosome-binding factor A|uniref:Ribosome-binding factor A n=1 Tax=Candidatus Seongchinamella marina TaxID=2518990 RepID=A0ABT3SXU4_9GAMM|nr:30S ribosome-binding factor RbfA [Candidatus Seongchinamella marina]EEB77922.1 ribosome-binding factor A [marine gamma proteobacterium HTCC2148]MBT3412219.1 30S ribosome-binding factor RbfA [Halieaceae bacterium]MDG1387361.1 30S ribosome-binding factor RbfA [Halioglobus sp.]MBT5008289.1 30S ribosome-binding factor RbfA [Halieaceae bacterium]MBT6125257.1 30S ribosome-binding factor RbfA [Halieaceae bacterium]
MAKEYARTQRVADFLQRELAALIQHEVRDPRVGMVSITGVDVSRDMGHAKVYYTSMSANSTDESKECNEALNKAAGFLRSQLSRESSMRMVPQLRFYFDSSVGRGRDMEDLIRKAADSDREMGLRDDSAEEQ